MGDGDTEYMEFSPFVIETRRPTAGRMFRMLDKLGVCTPDLVSLRHKFHLLSFDFVSLFDFYDGNDAVHQSSRLIYKSSQRLRIVPAHLDYCLCEQSTCPLSEPNC